MEKYLPETAWLACCQGRCVPPTLSSLNNLPCRSREMGFALENCVGPYRMESMQGRFYSPHRTVPDL